MILDKRTVFRHVLPAAMLRRAAENEIYHTGQIKIFPDGGAVLSAYTRPIIREAGWEGEPLQRSELADAAQEEGERSSDRANLERAQRRARAAVYDMCRCTQFDHFLTLTTDETKVDRFNDEEVFRKLHNWLDNTVRRHDLSYVLVPEYHKRGALHFHALVKGNLKYTDSGTLSIPGRKKPIKPRSKKQREILIANGAHVVYNANNWTLGFSTAIELYGDYRAACGYVTKYITKSDAKIGGRWYYSGGDLRRPSVIARDLDFEKVVAHARAAEAARAAAARAAHPEKQHPERDPVFTIDDLGVSGCRIEVPVSDIANFTWR